jgi:hypothetical protein
MKILLLMVLSWAAYQRCTADFVCGKPSCSCNFDGSTKVIVDCRTQTKLRRPPSFKRRVASIISKILMDGTDYCRLRNTVESFLDFEVDCGFKSDTELDAETTTLDASTTTLVAVEAKTLNAETVETMTLVAFQISSAIKTTAIDAETITLDALEKATLDASAVENPQHITTANPTKLTTVDNDRSAITENTFDIVTETPTTVTETPTTIDPGSDVWTTYSTGFTTEGQEDTTYSTGFATEGTEDTVAVAEEKNGNAGFKHGLLNSCLLVFIALVVACLVSINKLIY